jgi:hypothetical protein
LSKLARNLDRGKNSQKMLATSVIFKKTAQSKKSRIGLKFAQSVQPGTCIHAYIHK